MGIQICSNKGVGPFWGPVRGKIREKIINLQNLFLINHGRNALIFSMEHPWGKEIQVCSIKVPMVMYGPTPGA